MKFVIDRAKWLCGELARRQNDAGYTTTNSMLLDKHGRMCCLGFYAIACGIPPERISPYGSLRHANIFAAPDNLISDKLSAIVENALICDNDAFHITSDQREQYIRSRFATLDVEVEFVGEYPILSPAEAIDQ